MKKAEKNNFGVGIDIISIARFRKLKKDKIFLNKIFTRREIEYCLAGVNPAQHLAARYAGKEAVVKAVNCLGNNRLSVADYSKIEIINDKNGVPRVEIKKMEFKNLIIKISLSHCEQKAVAYAFAISDR